MKNLLLIVLFGGVLLGCSLDARLSSSSIINPVSPIPSLEKNSSSTFCADGEFETPVPIGEDLHLIYGEFSKFDFCSYGIFKDSLSEPKFNTNLKGGFVYKAFSDGDAGFFFLGNFGATEDFSPQSRLVKAHSGGQVNSSFQAFGDRSNIQFGDEISVAVTDGKLFLGGELTSSYNSYGALLNGQTAESLWANQNRFNSEVSAVVADGRGGLYIAVNGTYKGNYRGVIVRTDAEGQDLESFNVGLSGYVTALSYDATANILYVGGRNLAYPGMTTSSLFAVHGDTGAIISSWNPVITPSFTDITDIEVTNTTIYVSRLNSYNSANAGLYAINKSTGAILWQKSTTNMSGFYSLAHDGTYLYAVGGFFRVNGVNRNFIATFDSNGNLQSGPVDIPNSNVEAVLYADGYVYIGGLFSTVGGQARNGIARYRASDWTLDAWNPNPTSSSSFLRVNGLMHDGNGKIFVSGGFTSIGGKFLNSIAAITTDSSATVLDWNAQVTKEQSITGMALVGGNVFVAGSFTSIGVAALNGLAILDATSGQVLNAEIQIMGGNIQSMTVSQDKSTLYLGGTFRSINGHPRNGLAALNTSDLSVKSWNPITAADDWDQVVFVREYGGIVYIFGSFSEPVGLNLQTRSNSAAIDQSGNATSWSSSITSYYGINDVVVENGIMYVIGYLNVPGHENILVYDLNQSGSQIEFADGYEGSDPSALVVFNGQVYLADEKDIIDLGPDPGAQGVSASSFTTAKTFANFVDTLAVSDGALFVGGFSLGGPDRAGIALVDFKNIQVIDWTAPFHGGEIGVIYAAKKVGSYLYAIFQQAGEPSILVAINMDSGASIIHVINGHISGFESFNDIFYVVGEFGGVNEEGRSNLASFKEGELLPWQPSVAPVSSVVRNGDNIIIGGEFETVDGVARRGVAAFDGASGVLNDWNPWASSDEFHVYKMIPSGLGAYIVYEMVVDGEYVEGVFFVDTTMQVSNWTPPDDFDVWNKWYVKDGIIIHYKQSDDGLFAVSEQTLQLHPVAWEVPLSDLQIGSWPGIFIFDEGGGCKYIDENTGKVKFRIRRLQGVLE